VVRILVIGATGLIGSAVCARLAADGEEVVAVNRNPPTSGLGNVRHVALDIAKAAPKDFSAVLADIDAVVNCAGTLQDSPGDSTKGVHHRGVGALIAACRNQGVRRLVHLSAMGVDRETTSFSATKHAGEALIVASGLDWVILRPSVVVGRAAYGGTALMRGLAALPVQPVMADTGLLQLVWLDDVVQTIVFFLHNDAPCHQVLDLVGPRAWTFSEFVQVIRRWMRWPEPKMFAVPPLVSRLLYKVGDAVSALGWRPAVRTTARREIVYGAAGDPSHWSELTGMTPTDIEVALTREPASVQERWFARLYFLKPLIFGVFGLFWLVTGLVSFGPGWDIGISLMRDGGAGEPVASLAVIAGASADVLIGFAIFYRPTSRYGLYAALLISVAYAIIGSILVPRLWREPLGPMLKIWPIMVLNLVAIAIREDR
jgi:uncharacterized protein YbjT (DUF2867 family)